MTGYLLARPSADNAALSGNSGESQLATYIPRVDVRMILTGFSSRISRTSRFPEMAAARAKALRAKDDDFGSRIPPRRDCAATRPRPPCAGSRRSPLTWLVDEALPAWPDNFEGKNPLVETFISLATIPFVIEASLRDTR